MCYGAAVYRRTIRWGLVAAAWAIVSGGEHTSLFAAVRRGVSQMAHPVVTAIAAPTGAETLPVKWVSIAVPDLGVIRGAALLGLRARAVESRRRVHRADPDHARHLGES